MNRVTRLFASYLNRPTLRLLASSLAASPTPSLPRVALKRSALGSLVLLLAVGYFCWSGYGINALLVIWMLAELVFLVFNLIRYSIQMVMD